MQCDRCDNRATQTVGDYEVGEPYRLCDGCFAQQQQNIEEMTGRIREFCGQFRNWLYSDAGENARTAIEMARANDTRSRRGIQVMRDGS